jgi:hypothetical protein
VSKDRSRGTGHSLGRTQEKGAAPKERADHTTGVYLWSAGWPPPDGAAICAGDFNAEPDSAPLTLFRECGQFTGGWNGPNTFPAEAPNRTIDIVTHDGEKRVATLFTQHRDNSGALRLRRDRELRLTNGSPINDAIVERRSHWTESFRAVDWNGDGLQDLIYSLAGSHNGIQDGGSIYLLLNQGSRSAPLFAPPRTMKCFGEPIRITNHGPHPWPGDFDGDGKPDLLACVEWSVYPFYSHAALVMDERPTFQIELEK